MGQFKPNNFGLYDMLGNLWEWTCSQYENKYGGQERHCAKKFNKNSRLSLRGGSWGFGGDVSRVRSVNRGVGVPTYRFDFLGVRVARL
ncbi:Sulphatase-modifying factor domain protein [Candidatus Thiomargarita nelsonii]|uniref:Sulphatase-modifying factor domain protein n=1 Tax=Candidatus Thiomargarita nelsonii TaxID=1003181 RepID=A0A176S7M1_9GAMM|nr:Sulphatase-modifying factor domain protein [Candidatus Thiomargarita nelsonii]